MGRGDRGREGMGLVIGLVSGRQRVGVQSQQRRLEGAPPTSMVLPAALWVWQPRGRGPIHDLVAL